jgi:hypothetical protein
VYWTRSRWTVWARSLRQFCEVPVKADSSCYRQFLNQEDTRGDKHPPPPLHLLWQEKTGTVLPCPETRRNQELSPCTGTCQGVGSMTAPHMEHGAKPPGSFLSTPPCFLPIKRLRLQPLGYGHYNSKWMSMCGESDEAFLRGPRLLIPVPVTVGSQKAWRQLGLSTFWMHCYRVWSSTEWAGSVLKPVYSYISSP